MTTAERLRQCVGNVLAILVLVADVSVKDERSGVHGSRERALRRLQGGAVGRSILNAERLHALPGDRVGGGILAEELAVAHRRVVEGLLIVQRRVEVLPGGRVSVLVILRALDVEVTKPAELSVDVAVLDNGRPLGHAGAFDLVQLARVDIALRLKKNRLLLLEVLIE